MIRIGSPPLPGHTYTRRPGAYVILARGDQMLVTQQHGADEPLQLPGGGIDPGEQVLPALHREVLEETGWTMARPRRLGGFRRFTYMPEYDLWAEKICTIYLARPACRVGPPLEQDHTALWIDAAAAAQELDVPGDRYFVSQVFGLPWFN